MKISEASYLFLSEQYSTVFDQVDYYVEDNESYSEPEDSEEKDNVSKKRHPSEKLEEKKNWTNIFTNFLYLVLILTRMTLMLSRNTYSTIC